MNQEKTGCKAGTGIRRDFDYASGKNLEGVEIETKALIASNGKEVFANFRERIAPYVFGREWSKLLYSSYFDDDKNSIHNSGRCLRLRHQRDYGIAHSVDISSKSKGTRCGENGLERIEPETHLDDLKLDLSTFFDDHRDNPETLFYLGELANAFDNDPQRLQEAFFVSCKRISFNVCVYSVKYEDKQYIKFGRDLNGDATKARPIFFEFSLDRSRYFIPVSQDNKISCRQLGEDFEIEFEFKEGTDFYAPKDEIYQSHPDLDYAEIIRGQEFLVSHMKNLLSDADLQWKAPSKAQRGYAARERYVIENKKVASIGCPTVLGKPIKVIPVPEDFLLLACRPDLEGGPA